MSQSPVPKDASEIVRLSERGDVLLNVGKENQPAVRLLVSSALLSQASPVFEAMFNGRFAEGQDLSSDAPREISLPDDDSESMKILAKVIHYSAEDVDGTLSLDSLADFAVLCDEYDCTRAVISWSRLWAGQFLANPNMPGLEKLLFVTHVLNIPEEFRQATKVLLQNQATAINLDVAKHGLNLMPSNFLKLCKKLGTRTRMTQSKRFNPIPS